MHCQHLALISKTDASVCSPTAKWYHIRADGWHEGCAKIKHITWQHGGVCHVRVFISSNPTYPSLPSHLFFYTPLTPTLHPPDASHLLITPANLLEVRAQAAGCPPRSRSLSTPAAFHFLPQKVAKYGLGWGAEGSGGWTRWIEGEWERKLFKSDCDKNTTRPVLSLDFYIWSEWRESDKRWGSGCSGEQLGAYCECHTNPGQGRYMSV